MGNQSINGALNFLKNSKKIMNKNLVWGLGITMLLTVLAWLNFQHAFNKYIPLDGAWYAENSKEFSIKREVASTIIKSEVLFDRVCQKKTIISLPEVNCKSKILIVVERSAKISSISKRLSIILRNYA